MSDADDIKKKMMAAVDAAKKESDADIMVYCGLIDFDGWSRTYRCIQARKVKRDNVSLFITTSGGSPDSAFRIAAFMKQSYKGKFRLVVDWYCKSAGTLLAVGADELVISDIAELGPVDVQLKKPDEYQERTSGLTPFQALKALRELAYQDFMYYFLETRRQGLGYITTKTAAEVATGLVVGMYQPIYGQIDPMRVGEMTRAMTIGHHYGERLGEKNLKDGALAKLISGYPSHSCVIDRAEAAQLFKAVRAPTDVESELMGILHAVVEQHVDDDDALVSYLDEVPDGDEDDHETPSTSAGDQAVGGPGCDPPPDLEHPGSGAVGAAGGGSPPAAPVPATQPPITPPASVGE